MTVYHPKHRQAKTGSKLVWKKRRADLRTVFHSDESRLLDAQIARLCVLYEDLRVETQALSAKRIRVLDKANHRNNYFVRRSIATLHEFSEALKELDDNAEFQPVRKQFNAQHLRQWQEALGHFRACAGKKGRKGILTAIRDDIGGHFGINAAKQAVKCLDSGIQAELKVSRTRTGKHEWVLYFARHLAVSPMVKHAREQKFPLSFPGLLKVILAGYKHAIRSVQIIIIYYLWDQFSEEAQRILWSTGEQHGRSDHSAP